MFLVEVRHNGNPKGVYPFKLVCIRHVQAGPVFEIRAKENQKSTAIFLSQVDAVNAARRTVDELNEQLRGGQIYTFQVIPATGL